MNNYNFELICCDTDAITITKQDQAIFTEKELEQLTKELNAQFPSGINWEFEFNVPKMIVLKAKNYLIYDGKKLKIKGSSLKSATLEPALKQMLNEFIDALIEDRQQDMVSIYHKYIKMVRDDITDIKPWSKKMQLSPTTFNSTRANETKVIDAIKGTEYKSGDRIYVYTTPEDTLRLAEQFDGRYDKPTYYEKLFKTTKRFETILPVKEMFINYALKKNLAKVDEL